MDTPPTRTIAARIASAWQRHPLHEFIVHRRRLALLRQLSGYLRSGVGLPVALAEMARFAASLEERARLGKVASTLERGGDLAAALAGMGLDDVTVDLIAVGEETGTLGRLLPTAIARLEAAQTVRWRFAAALIHPGYLGALMVFVAPLFSLGEALRHGKVMGDLPRLYALGVGRNLVVAAAIAIGLVALPLLPSLLDVEARWDRARGSLPLLGTLYRQLYASRLLSVLATMLGAGANAPRAIEVAVRGTRSPSLAPQSASIAKALAGGQSLTDALIPLGVLDPPTLGALAVAERAGELDTVPLQLAAELAASSARRMRAVLAIAVAVIVAALLVKVVIATVASFVGTMNGFDEDLDKLMKQ